MPAKLSLQARLINLLSELDDAGVEAQQLSEGVRPAFRRLVGVATADLFLGARSCGIAREGSRAAQEQPSLDEQPGPRSSRQHPSPGAVRSGAEQP